MGRWRSWQTYFMPSLLSDHVAISVLIVDDDEVSREVLATILTIGGYDVLTASEASKAVAMLEAGKCSPQVILADLRMPGMGGAELIAQLRERTLSGSGTAVLAMSASEPRAGEVKDADGFLRKPFGAEELAQALMKRESTVVGQEPPGATLVSALKPRRLEQLRQMMAERAVHEIYSAVVTDLRRRLRDLDGAIERRDAAAVRHIGHAIKGGCGMAGADETAQVGAMLESVPDDLKNVRPLMSQLRKSVQNLEDVLAIEFPMG